MQFEGVHYDLHLGQGVHYEHNWDKQAALQGLWTFEMLQLGDKTNSSLGTLAHW